MTEHEITTIAISLVALVLSIVFSLITTYYTFFYSTRRLVVATRDLIYKDNFHNAEVVFVNTGTESFSITNVHFVAIHADAQSFKSAGYWGFIPTDVDGIQSDIVLSDAAFVLKPNEIKVVRLRSPIDLTEGYPTQGVESMNIGIGFTTYDNRGIASELLGLMPFTVGLHAGRVTSAHRSNEFDREHRQVFSF